MRPPNDHSNTPLSEGPRGLQGRAAEEEALRIEKLALEGQLLRLSLTRSGRVMEWLKAGSVPAAFIGLLAAFGAAGLQVRQTEENRLNERFDRAIVRLSSDRIADRLAGVSGLRYFAFSRHRDLQAQALAALVNAAAVESDGRIQSSILDTFSQTPGMRAPNRTLDQVLAAAVDQSRNVLAEAERKAAAARLSDSGASLRLGRDGYGEDVEYWTEAVIGSDAEVQARSLARILVALAKSGARTKDFRGIYCPGCDFSSLNLDDANFSEAVLNGSDFSKSSLIRARFADSDVSGVKFNYSNLQKAVFQITPPVGPLRIGGWRHTPLPITWGESLELLPRVHCADLRGADVSGLPLLVAYDEVESISIATSIVYNATMDSTTKLDTIRIILISNRKARDAADSEILSDAALYFGPGHPISRSIIRRSTGPISSYTGKSSRVDDQIVSRISIVDYHPQLGVELFDKGLRNIILTAGPLGGELSEIQSLRPNASQVANLPDKLSCEGKDDPPPHLVWTEYEIKPAYEKNAGP